MAYFAALWIAKPQLSPIESQNAILGKSTVTKTDCAITNSVIIKDDHAITLFFENLLVKNPAKNTIKTYGARKKIWSMKLCQMRPFCAKNDPERIF